MESNNSYIIEFQSKYCKQKEHNNCSNNWIGLGFTVTCTCNCHKEINEKNLVLEEPRNFSNTTTHHILSLEEIKYDN